MPEDDHLHYQTIFQIPFDHLNDTEYAECVDVLNGAVSIRMHAGPILDLRPVNERRRY